MLFQPSQSQISIRASNGQRPTLLFVDDEERILRTLRMLFRGEYEVKTTTSGLEAIEIARNEKVHVVVSDQRMPIMPGVEVLRAIKEASPNTMRLLLTGYSDLEAIVGSINEGEIFRYIAKPWNTEEIRITVAKAMEIAISLDEVQLPFVETTLLPAERILVIDDDPDTAVAIREALEEKSASHIVEWASNLDEVFRILEHREVALVITEIHLQEHDITPLIKTLKRYHPNVISMVLTSFRDTGLLVDLINQGQVYRFLPKPVRKGLIANTIRDALKRHQALRLRPELARRHEVELIKAPVENKLAQRITGFMKRFRVSA